MFIEKCLRSFGNELNGGQIRWQSKDGKKLA